MYIFKIHNARLIVYMYIDQIRREKHNAKESYGREGLS